MGDFDLGQPRYVEMSKALLFIRSPVLCQVKRPHEEVATTGKQGVGCKREHLTVVTRRHKHAAGDRFQYLDPGGIDVRAWMSCAVIVHCSSMGVGTPGAISKEGVELDDFNARGGLSEPSTGMGGNR
jgi:hypothetical protein